MAAVAGVDPYSETITVRELVIMARAVMKENWDHTAAIMCMLYNTNSKKPKKMLDFHPFRSSKKEHYGKKGQLTGVPLECFKSICKNIKEPETESKPKVVPIPQAERHETHFVGTPLEAFKAISKNRKGNK